MHQGIDAVPVYLELKPEDIDLFEAHSDNIFDNASDASSVQSLDSIFSNFTTSTMSSMGAGPEADENLYILLTGDGLRVLYARIVESMSMKGFERALRHLLVTFSTDLRKEASDQKEKYAAKVVRYRARNLANLINGR